MNLLGKCQLQFVFMLPSFVVIVLLWYLVKANQPMWVEAAYLGSLLLAGNILYFAAQAAHYLQRWLSQSRCERNDDLLQAYHDALSSPDKDQVRHALQVVADVWNHPFGLVDCWPLDRMGDERVRATADLYAQALAGRYELHAHRLGSELLRRLQRSPAAQRMIAQLRGSVDVGKLDPPPLPEDIEAEVLTLELPPLAGQPFLRAMRSKVEAHLLRMTAAINEARTCADVPAAAIKVNEGFAELCWDAIHTGLRLRLTAATGRAFPGLAAHSLSDIKRVARAQLSLLLFRIALLYGEEDARAIFPDNLPRVRRLLRDFWWSGFETGMKLGDAPAPAPTTLGKATQVVGDTVNQCLDSIGMAVRETLGDLAGIDPAAPPAAGEATEAAPRGSVGKPVAAYLDAAADRVKDAILDLEIPRSEGFEPPALPPLDREEFLRVGREHFDRVLGEFADAINREDTEIAIERNTEDVHHLLGELGLVLLDTAVHMRVDKAAKEGIVGSSEPGRARGKRLADIRLPPPPTPRSQGGWVDKYRRMRARHG
jgi:hypothetical protein